MSDARKNLEYWLTDDYFDAATKAELEAIKDDDHEVEERFYKELEFGTGGLRGVIGAGLNRMNIYTVRKATQGLANYILKNGDAAKGVAISFDCRRMSPEFADETALTLAANGIKAYVFESLRPTPELSFALRELHCQAGVMITASHNPPEYNGYKAYWEDGAQVTPPHDKGIITEVKVITDFHDVKTMDKDEAIKAGLYEVIGQAIDDKYMAALKEQIIHQDAIDATAGDLKIVYTPFHGTGLMPVKRVLKELGFQHVFVVPEQEEPDPEFTTLDYPNPEDEKAFEYALRYAKEQDADIVMATDPDADRLGVYAKDAKTGEYVAFTGNMSGMLIAEYVLRERTATNAMVKDPAFVTTIVTTNLAKAIAEHYGCTYIETLTGFKYIGEQIKLFEQNGSHHYAFGLEESYGCLVGTHARDKDAIVAVMMLSELAAFYKREGKTLWDAMIDIYEKYGYYKEGQYSITMKGIEGAAEIEALMNKFRTAPPEKFGDWTVEEFRDYKSGECKNLQTGALSSTGLPESNVLYFALDNDAWCCARPSGTEPKIKFYMGVKGKSLEDADALLEKLTAAVKQAIES